MPAVQTRRYTAIAAQAIKDTNAPLSRDAINLCFFRLVWVFKDVIATYCLLASLNYHSLKRLVPAIRGFGIVNTLR